jgi:2-keto-4-pentenoate hydratase/2-oxohepta-3-ene-1,7-dioic acid hydratase in catechol pathway
VLIRRIWEGKVRVFAEYATWNGDRLCVFTVYRNYAEHAKVALNLNIEAISKPKRKFFMRFNSGSDGLIWQNQFRPRVQGTPFYFYSP